MTTVRALNDDEVFNEMKKMADEEFNIEKAKIVRQESLNIEAVFERKIKQAEVQKRIAQSNHINKARLRTLQAREQVLQELFEETQHRVKELDQNEEAYSELLKDLLLQGVYTLMDADTEIRVREVDVEKAQFAIEVVKAKYEETLKQELNITISDNYLPASCAGGVILTGLQGKIIVDNTFEARLDIVKDDMLPQLRVVLFGHSPNRKFFN
ncbi:ATP synthase subunit [Cunninghamella echinulata]|nr:ATP synthase subunit [Cunninghamella echinulata]